MKNLLILAALFLFSCGDSSVNIEGADVEGTDNSGNNVTPPPNNNNSDSNNSGGSGGGTGYVANSVIITLRYWESKETDGLFGSKLLDPRISFIVTSRQGGRTVSTNKTGYLLDKDDLGQTWSGSSKSSPVPFITSADEVRIEAFVEEKDVLSNDDISPGYYVVFYPPFRISSGTETLDYGNGKSKVRFDYEFVWQ